MGAERVVLVGQGRGRVFLFAFTQPYPQNRRSIVKAVCAVLLSWQQKRSQTQLQHSTKGKGGAWVEEINFERETL